MEKSNTNYVAQFDDPTLVDADGHFSEVQELTREDGDYSWTLLSTIMIFHDAGAGIFELNLNQDKDVVITDFTPSNVDPKQNREVRYLVEWCFEHGWNCPTPHKDVVKDHYNFWRFYWENGLIQSPYFDNRLGK